MLLIVDKNEENSAVVPPFLANLPSLKSALGEIFRSNSAICIFRQMATII